VPGVHIRLERHPEYYLPDRPYLDGILFKIITDESTRLANIRSGDVDFTRFYDPKHARVLGNNADATVIEGPSLTRELLRINVTRPPLDDARVRQALSLAINRDELVRAAIFGVGTTTGPIAPALKDWAVPVTSLPYLQYDSARARELLAAAGHASGLNLTIKTSRPQSIAAAQIIQRHLKAVGVEVEILPLEWGVFNRDIRRQEYDLAIHALLSEPDPDVYFAQVYKTGSVLNVSGYSNPRVDALIERGVSTGDRAQRKAIYDELQRLVDEEAPTPTLFTQNRVDVVRKTVKGYAQIPNGSRITYRDTWLER
jgi:peptide/nickel transport system substrate-binding protein